MEEKDLEYWKQSYKDMFKRACEYKNEITDLREENQNLREENKKLKEERDKYYAEWHLRHS